LALLKQEDEKVITIQMRQFLWKKNYEQSRH
jgi:hypothetical protein